MIPIVLFAAAFLVRAAVGLTFPGPAYPDSYYYAHVGERLASGLGLTVDYVWNMDDIGTSMSHGLPIAANALWMPLAEAIQAPFIWLLGPSGREAKANLEWAASHSRLLIRRRRVGGARSSSTDDFHPHQLGAGTPGPGERGARSPGNPCRGSRHGGRSGRIQLPDGSTGSCHSQRSAPRDRGHYARLSVGDLPARHRPLLVGLTVAALIGGDSFVAWLVERRDWQRQNAWLAPAALLALTVPIALFQLVAASRQAAADERAVAGIAAVVPGVLATAGVSTSAPVITDRPIWLSDALSRSTLALPAEPASTVLDLAKRFGAQSVVVVEDRGAYPDALGAQPDCFTTLDPASTGGASVFLIRPECVR